MRTLRLITLIIITLTGCTFQDTISLEAENIVEQYQPNTIADLEASIKDYLGANWSERTPEADRILQELNTDPLLMEDDEFYFFQLAIHNAAVLQSNF